MQSAEGTGVAGPLGRQEADTRLGPGWVGSVAFVETPVGSENVAVKLGADFSIHFSQSSPAC